MLMLTEQKYVLENVHITEEMTKKMLANVNPLFHGQSNISGFLSLNCNDLQIPFSAEDRKKLFVDAVVSIDNAQLQPKGLVSLIIRSNDGRPVPLKLLPTQFLFQNETVSYDNMEFHLDRDPTGFSGMMQLDGYADMFIAMPWRVDFTKDIDFLPIKVGEDLSRRLRLPCQGPVGQFHKCIRWDKIADQFMQEYIRQKGGDILRDIFK